MGLLADDKRSRNLDGIVEVEVEDCTWPFEVVMVEAEGCMLEVTRE